jgi:serine/threonine-protein kinase
VDHFRRAIARDSTFARAYAGLSMALELLPYFGGVPAAEVRAPVTEAANRALALDTTLAEALVALGLAAEHAYEWQTAGSEFQRAIMLAPREQPVHLQYGRYLLYINRVADARAEFDIAKSLDPYSALPSAWLGETLSIQGRQEEGLSEFRRALEIDSVNGPALQFMGPFLARSGRTDEARIVAERLPKSQIVYEGIVGYMLAVKGDRAGAMQIEHQLRSSKSTAWFTNTSLAYIYLGLRDTSRALASLERATDRGEIWPTYMPIRDPMYDEVRQSAHFAALLRRVGLQDVTFAAPSADRPR